jgi:hypothetical protein
MFADFPTAVGVTLFTRCCHLVKDPERKPLMPMIAGVYLVF